MQRLWELQGPCSRQLTCRESSDNKTGWPRGWAGIAHGRSGIPTPCPLQSAQRDASALRAAARKAGTGGGSWGRAVGRKEPRSGRGRGGGRWKDFAAAKAGVGRLHGRWEGPRGGFCRLLPDYKRQLPGLCPAAPQRIVNFHPQRATAADHVIRANMAAAAAGS